MMPCRLGQDLHGRIPVYAAELLSGMGLLFDFDRDIDICFTII